jgi:hypothetical protein
MRLLIAVAVVGRRCPVHMVGAIDKSTSHWPSSSTARYR